MKNSATRTPSAIHSVNHMPNHDHPDPSTGSPHKHLNSQSRAANPPTASWPAISNRTVLILGSSLVATVFAALASWLSIHGLTFAAASRILAGGGSIGLALASLAGCSHSFRLRIMRPASDAPEKPHD